MITLKIGMFPGRLNEYAMESGVTVREALDMADIELNSESDVKLDGESVSLGDTINRDGTLVVTKRIKGNF